MFIKNSKQPFYILDMQMNFSIGVTKKDMEESAHHLTHGDRSHLIQHIKKSA